MLINRLIVVSADLHPRYVHNDTRGEAAQHWIYAGKDVRLRLEWEHSLGEVVLREEMGERLQQAADDLSDEFNDWIDVLGRRYNSLGWWLGQIAEKNPFVSPLFFHICYLKSIIDIVEHTPERNWLVVVESRGLRRALLSFAQESGWDAVEISQWSTDISAAWHALKAIYYGLLSRMALAKGWFSLRWSLRKLCGDEGVTTSALQDQQGTILIHSWLRDDSVSDEGEFVDHFFGVLPEKLRERGYDVRYFFLPDTVIARQSALNELLGLLADKGNLFPSHRYLKWVDLLAAIFLPVVICWLPRRVSRFGDWDIGHLLSEERWSQVWSSRTSASYLYYAFAKRLGRAGKSFYRVLGTFENHIWEKALNLGLHHYVVADQVVGFQHTSLNWNSNNWSPRSFELQSGVLPDRVVCTGSVWVDQLRRQGYPSVILGGALRFGALPSALQESDHIAEAPVIMVTSNAGEHLTLEVLRQVYLAFGQDSSKEIWIKIHPHLELRTEVYEFVFDGEVPAHFHFVDEPIAALLSRVDLLIYSSTSVCFEALARGIPVISIVPETFIDLDDLRFFPHLLCAISSPESLRNKVSSLLTRTDQQKALWLEEVQQAVGTVFTPVTAATIEAFVKQ